MFQTGNPEEYSYIMMFQKKKKVLIEIWVDKVIIKLKIDTPRENRRKKEKKYS